MRSTARVVRTLDVHHGEPRLEGARVGVPPSPAVGAVCVSLSAITVAITARRLRGVDLA